MRDVKTCSTSSTDSSSSPHSGPPTHPLLHADLVPTSPSNSPHGVPNAANATSTVAVEDSTTTPPATTIAPIDSGHSGADGECFSDEWLADMRRVKVRATVFLMNSGYRFRPLAGGTPLPFPELDCQNAHSFLTLTSCVGVCRYTNSLAGGGQSRALLCAQGSTTKTLTKSPPSHEAKSRPRTLAKRDSSERCLSTPTRSVNQLDAL